MARPSPTLRPQCLETDRAGLIKWAETEKQQLVDSFEQEKEHAVKAKVEARSLLLFWPNAHSGLARGASSRSG